MIPVRKANFGKADMRVFRKIYCRAVQGAVRLVMPFFPYRAPKLLGGADEAAHTLLACGRKKSLVVTDAGVRGHGLLGPLLEAFDRAGLHHAIFDKTAANPTMSDVEAALSLYRAEGCDAVVALGGGSPIDCAKGVCARLMRPKKSLAELRGLLKVRGKAPFFMAVPTTAGTGSEATVAAVITDEARRCKFTILSFSLVPQYALLDPLMTKSLPPAPTAETGMDALTHAVEAYIGRATTKKTRAQAVEAVRLIRENLVRCYENGGDLAARENMQRAAYLAGLAFTLSYVGYVHALAHALGGVYNAPHGRTNATLLPAVLRAYGSSCRKKLARLARESGVCEGELSDMDASEAFIRWIETLDRTLGIPENIKIEARDLDLLAARADREANPLYPVPRLFDRGELRAILQRVME